MDEKDILIKQLKVQDKQNTILKKIYINYYLIEHMLSINGKILINNYLNENNITNIVIYGAGAVGKVLFDELNKIDNVRVNGVIDKKISNNFDFKNTKLILPTDIKNVNYDIIIITPIFVYEEIKNELKEKKVYNTISLIEIFK